MISDPSYPNSGPSHPTLDGLIASIEAATTTEMVVAGDPESWRGWVGNDLLVTDGPEAQTGYLYAVVGVRPSSSPGETVLTLRSTSRRVILGALRDTLDALLAAEPTS